MESLHYFDNLPELEPPLEKIPQAERQLYFFRRAMFNWWNSLEDNWKTLLLYAARLQSRGYPTQICNDELRGRPIEPEKKSDLLNILKIEHLCVDYFGGEIYFDKLIPFTFLPNLQTVGFEGQGFKCFDTMRGLQKLRDFSVVEDNIQSLEFLRPNISKTLERLFLWSVNWDGQLDFSILSELTKLSELSLLENEVADIGFVASLTKLTDLEISTNSKLHDISPLSGLKKLQSLELGYNCISDISPLSSLTKLRWLDLDQNHIQDISPLTKLKQLTNLTLSNNPIKDFSPLMKLTGLKSLWLDNTAITQAEQIKLQQALPNCSIHVRIGESYSYNCPDKREW